MFTYRSDGELSVRCYLIDPKTIDDVEKAVYWGNNANQSCLLDPEMIS